MNLQPTLEDNLIVLKPLDQGHFEALYEVAKDPLIWKQHPCSDRYKRNKYSDFFIDSINSKGAFVIIDKTNQNIIGSTRFKKIANTENAIEIGWSFLSRDKWGGKYNRSMKSLMITHAFEFVDDIIFYIGKDNIRSQKAVQKIGGKIIVEAHLMPLVKDSKTDCTYRINKQDWEQIKPTAITL